MSETDSFIQEVTEEVRQDQMFALWKKWAPAIIGGVALIVGGAAYWSYSQSEKQKADEARGGLFLQADPEEADLQIALPDKLDGPAKVLGEFTAAAALADRGDTDEAGERFADLASRSDVPQVYRDLALLQAVRYGASDDALADLGRLVDGQGAFRHLALEQRASLRLQAGDTQKAHEDLRMIVDDSDATPATRQRALAILTATGGTVVEPEG